MLKQLLSIALYVAFLWWIAATNAFASCHDDPRLPAALRELAKGAEKISPPLTLSPETWLAMDGEFREMLAGNATICPGIAVLKNGKPLKKLELDFAAIWPALRNAAMQNNREKVKWIFDSFKAAPMPLAEIIKTIDTPGMTEKGQALLCEITGVANEKHTMIIDFYTALGGRPSDKTKLRAGKAFSADVFSDYPCQNFNDWVTIMDMENWSGQRYIKQIYEKLDLLGIDSK